MLAATFSDETQERMRDFFNSLNERDRRRYAGLEASKLGHGGISCISEILGCDRKTVSKGIAELIDPPELEPGRIRKKGGTSVLSLLAR
jgi:hypothetical protein